MYSFFIRHFKSRGFKKRVKNWYLPAIKMGLLWLYNKPHGFIEKNKFEKLYAEDKVILVQPKGEETPDEELGVYRPPLGKEEVVLTYEQAVEVIKPYLINHSPQYLGTCVAHSIKNAIRFATKVAFGKDMDLAEGDIYIDRETLNFGIDSGMYTEKAFARVIGKGVAIQKMVPEARTTEELLTITRETAPDSDLKPFRVGLIKESRFVPSYHYFEPIWAMITNDYKKSLRPFQFTISSYLGWWGTDIPKATGEIRGSHSVIGISLPFMFNGERAFFALDSAYQTGRTWRIGAGVRIVTESCWNNLGISAREIVFIDEIEKKLGNKKAPSVLVTQTAKFGDSGLNVENIQRALISLGYTIPAIQDGVAGYGYYGAQTSFAVMRWQTDHWRSFCEINNYWTKDKIEKLEGRSFGALSVKVINTQI